MQDFCHQQCVWASDCWTYGSGLSFGLWDPSGHRVRELCRFSPAQLLAGRPGLLILTYPRDPSIPYTLGPTACKWYLLWARGCPRALAASGPSRSFGPCGVVFPINVPERRGNSAPTWRPKFSLTGMPDREMQQYWQNSKPPNERALQS